ncbi:unnamed protein product [Schistosoma intercalatum]|nr:unnamed protein product [Schistosoma intercalatum]CAH8589817.1 unnamed protein product [Schistosoma intercalatum]
MLSIQLNSILYLLIFNCVNKLDGLKLSKLCTTLTVNLRSQISINRNVSLIVSSLSSSSDMQSHLNQLKYQDKVMMDDNGFELRIRRVNDGVMIDEWYEPGRKYYVILTNRFHSVGFRDGLIWIEPNMNKEKMMMNIKMDSSTLVDSKSLNGQLNSNTLTDNMNNCSSRELGEWIHLTNQDPNNNILSDLWTTETAVTQTRLGCEGLTAEKISRTQRLVTKMIVIWKAPLKDKCGCININAAVQTHNEQREIFSAIGGLTKTLCPSYTRPPSPVLPAYMLPVNDRNVENSMKGRTMKLSHDEFMHLDSMQPQDCCACGSATYKLTFTGMWTRATHPKDWPVHNPGALHWTNLIGASHSPSFQIYRMGEPASAGVQAVCTYGDTTVMKQSLGIAATNTGSLGGVPSGTQRGSTGIGPLLSLVSAPGMWGEEALEETRTTYVGVNRTHPLISFLTMLGPSPNWCTGISSQSVCQADCTWVKNIEIDLFPWDAGARNGDTYLPKNSDNKDVPEPIRFITRDWMPNSPFTPGVPVAKLILERVLPNESWECTSKLYDGVELFHADGSTETVGSRPGSQSNKHSPIVQSVIGDLTGALPKKTRNKIGSGGVGGTRITSGGLGGDDPLSDPSLAQMATFLCVTSPWSAWGSCSVTCGVGRRTRQRDMLINKKTELCQHVPLVEEESCDGIKRTCDFSAMCSLLPWTAWTPCNATCDKPHGWQTRTRYLARSSEKNYCEHIFPSETESNNGTLRELKECQPKDTDCDPATICSEGRKDGIECGEKVLAYYYSAIEHACLPFKYLGCKGGRNRFPTKQDCEDLCIPAVEALPNWRRERIALLQYQTAQLATDSNDFKNQSISPAKHCSQVMDPGYTCMNDNPPQNRWYFCPRLRRCRDFEYRGCGGNENNFETYHGCLSDCLPLEMEKLRQINKARMASMRTYTNDTSVIHNNVTNNHTAISIQKSVDDKNDVDSLNEIEHQKLNDISGHKQDCIMTTWSGWSPCSVSCSHQKGTQMRWRYIEKPSMHGGNSCGTLFEKRECHGIAC